MYATFCEQAKHNKQLHFKDGEGWTPMGLSKVTWPRYASRNWQFAKLADLEANLRWNLQQLHEGRPKLRILVVLLPDKFTFRLLSIVLETKLRC